MPVYTVAANLKTSRATASQSLKLFFEHAEPMGLSITALSMNTAGTVSITITQTLTAAQRTHLGLA